MCRITPCSPCHVGRGILLQARHAACVCACQCRHVCVVMSVCICTRETLHCMALSAVALVPCAVKMFGLFRCSLVPCIVVFFVARSTRVSSQCVLAASANSMP